MSVKPYRLQNMALNMPSFVYWIIIIDTFRLSASIYILKKRHFVRFRPYAVLFHFQNSLIFDHLYNVLCFPISTNKIVSESKILYIILMSPVRLILR